MKTYGELKQVIKAISLKQKGTKIGDVAIDVALGVIPGVGAAKTTFDFVKAAFFKPDAKKTNSWLDKLDIDDEMSSIVDDTVENGFLEMISKTIESESNDAPLEQDFNMNQKMVDYLKKEYGGRTVTGIKEEKSVFDKFFTKFAYKFDKGYPDMNNDQDVLLLESLINKLLELDFQDTPDLPQEIEDIRSGINSEGTYTVNAIQSKNKSGTKYWVYIDDVAATVRTARLEVTKDLMAKGLLPKGEIKGGTTENFYLEGEDGVTYVIKGTGSKFTTSTNVKEGFVILFYNALKNGWNKSKDPFNDKNMTSLLSDLESLGNGIYTGLGKAEGEIITYLKNFDDGASGSKSAQVSLNDPLSSALRIFKDYPDGDMMRGEYFNTIKTRQEQVTGLPQDKVNPGDIFLKVGEVSLPKTKDIDVTGLEEINKIFVNKWGDKNGLVSISLKQEKAQGGKAKSFLGRYNPDKIDGKEYNLSKEELKYSDDQFDSAIDQLKKSTVEKISSSEFINYNPGKNPSTTARKKFKLAAYKNLDFLFKYLDKLGSSTPADGLVNMTAFGMSITSVNPTFFKVIGKGSGEMADVPERTPAGATAQLTPGTKITIEDKDSYGGLKIIVYVDVLEGAEVYSQYELELVMRSNGNEQNTIEIQKSTKK